MTADAHGEQEANAVSTAAAGTSTTKKDTEAHSVAVAIFGVFDGHGGTATSEYLRQRTAAAVLGASPLAPSHDAVRDALVAGDPRGSLLRRFLSRPAASLRNAMRLVDAEYDAEYRRLKAAGEDRQARSFLFAGSTALCLAVVD